ncbi:hypothetical protein J4233_02360 [Candidatus Pacearchaeota archaeon]|nr:hypothetical protein [Candidatus Pacearchaeota archaeon]
MRRLAFAVFVVGMFLMFVLVNLSPEEIDDIEEIELLELNTRISVSGEVVKERIIYEGTRILEFDNGVVVLCECDGSFKGKDVKIIGKVSDYEGERQIVAEEILF